MNCEKIKTDFKKRFESDCEKIYFMGKPLTFFKGNGRSLGCSVSAGCFLAMEKRDDERLMIEFSGSDRFITVNASELDKINSDEIFSVLSKVQKIGVKIGGVRLFFYHNTRLHTENKDILLSALNSFCENVPPCAELYRHFDDFETGILSATSKANYLSLFDGCKSVYFPLSKDRFKIVLCNIKDKRVRDFAAADTKIDRATDALANGDYMEFGRLLNMEAENVIKRNGLKATAKLFEAAMEQKESLGNGVLYEGGIFSLVENKDVDFFVRNVSAKYRKFYGAAPNFYVTDTETSGLLSI